MRASERAAARKRYGWRLVRESDAGVQSIYGGARILTPADLVALMAPFAALEAHETFWAICLDSQRRVARDGVIVISRGSLTSTIVHPREVFREVILREASAVIVCHNHPSGDPTPSPDDREVTEKMVAAGTILGIPVYDHVILGSEWRYCSFAEKGWI